MGKLCISCCLTLERLLDFCNVKGWGGGGIPPQFTVLKSWPYTSKFTIDHPEQFSSQSKASINVGGPWNALDHDTILRILGELLLVSHTVEPVRSGSRSQIIW